MKIHFLVTCVTVTFVYIPVLVCSTANLSSLAPLVVPARQFRALSDSTTKSSVISLLTQTLWSPMRLIHVLFLFSSNQLREYRILRAIGLGRNVNKTTLSARKSGTHGTRPSGGRKTR